MSARIAALCAVAPGLALAVATAVSLRPIPSALPPSMEAVARPRILDRNGGELSITHENRWNVHHRVPLQAVPATLRNAFVVAEDGRFFEHAGVDWQARAAALWQNLRAGRVVRGASTISEQVVRMLHPRPRTLWSRWLETFEASLLESRFGKGEILAFYLDQVPYARQRRGVAQASRLYFDRDLGTLSAREMLALAVLVRSPSRLDLYANPERGASAVLRLARRMRERGLMSEDELAAVARGGLDLRRGELRVQAPHFVRFVRSRSRRARGTSVRTALDGTLQLRAQSLLDARLADLAGLRVENGAVLVVDHTTDEILAWVAAGVAREAEGEELEARPGFEIDAVLAPRQPGSTLKPFLYALALEQGWTAATLVDDAPLLARVGTGLHAYRNYSGVYRGPVRVREALGNSLNTPAVRTFRSLAPGSFLERLHRLGIASLDRHPSVYGEGLALGSGEVSLFELVGAYAVLARGGVQRPLEWELSDHRRGASRRVFSASVASIVSSILSDPEARRLEFGAGGPLDLPVETAVKTGTSTAHRDAWAVGYSDRHVVGVWMGNLDRRETDGLSGSSGPARVLRAIFAELRRRAPSRPLPLSPELRMSAVCAASGQLAGPRCPSVPEWFRPERAPKVVCALHGEELALGRSGQTRPAAGKVALVRPSPGLRLARDPRIPDALEAFELEVAVPRAPARVDWIVDGRTVASTFGRSRSAWALEPGRHVARARVWLEETGAALETESVAFSVR